MISLSNVVLSFAFLILTGYHLLALIPEGKRAAIDVPRWLLLLLTGVIPFMLLAPVWNILTVLVTQFQVSWVEALYTVFFSYSSGQAAWLSILTAVVLFVLTIRNSGSVYMKVSALLLVLILIALSGWASHAASLTGLSGFIANTGHLLGVSAWIGVLFVLGWFGKHLTDAKAFSAWFSPLALVSVTLIIGSGFLLMGEIAPEYVNAWMLTYGQLLLIKHILFIPLLLFGAHHIWLIRKSNNQLNLGKLQMTFRIEALIAFIIIAISAFMTEETPPHEVIQTLQTENTSFLFELFQQQPLLVNQMLQLEWNMLSVSLIALSFVFLLTASRWLTGRVKVWSAMASLFVFCFLFYAGLMQSVLAVDTAVDETIYETKIEAIEASYASDSIVSLLAAEELDEHRVMTIYTVNDQDLVAEVLEATADGYKRLPAAMLTVGGTAVTDEDQKIRTFRVQHGNWHDEAYKYTYVTFGMIKEPVDVARVQIHYEGGSYIAELENHVFINKVSSQELWNDQHPIDFLSDDGSVIETYARQVMEEGVYCH
ncbi:CopD family protein [Alkalihalophilus pseudofirmus]|uniref:CopD family protein n=1 Tax=Alkalihalophilus pseudofirmus TaxID=79885 RepID=A0AAJ2KU36_ALKPS|nr:CopD family protein [Alkalihalophilus pseudofirmus]MDV2885132.1 CopD family protein [Alkalihalophilus pseudofirmus]